MAKTKLRWEFPQTIFTTTVLPSEFSRTHWEIEYPIVLHNCLYGYDEQGEHVKTLYCTRSGRFFARAKDGWSEQLPNTAHLFSKHPDKRRPRAAGGGTNNAFLRHFGAFSCHRLVAYAWCEHPYKAKLDPQWYRHYEVDHLNGDRSNWSAANLEWTTSKENNRRRWAVLDPLRKLGIAPKMVNIPHLKALYAFEECQLEHFFEHLPIAIQTDDRALDLENINEVIHRTFLDTLNKTITCDRCGRRMIVGAERHSTRYGTLCDCCYGDLYGRPEDV